MSNTKATNIDNFLEDEEEDVWDYRRFEIPTPRVNRIENIVEIMKKYWPWFLIAFILIILFIVGVILAVVLLNKKNENQNVQISPTTTSIPSTILPPIINHLIMAFCIGHQNNTYSFLSLNNILKIISGTIDGLNVNLAKGELYISFLPYAHQPNNTYPESDNINDLKNLVHTILSKNILLNGTDPSQYNVMQEFVSAENFTYPYQRMEFNLDSVQEKSFLLVLPSNSTYSDLTHMLNDMTNTSNLIKTVIKNIKKTVLVSLDIDVATMASAYQVNNGTEVELIQQGQDHIDSIVKALNVTPSVITTTIKPMTPAQTTSEEIISSTLRTNTTKSTTSTTTTVTTTKPTPTQSTSTPTKTTIATTSISIPTTTNITTLATTIATTTTTQPTTNTTTPTSATNKTTLPTQSTSATSKTSKTVSTTIEERKSTSPQISSTKVGSEKPSFTTSPIRGETTGVESSIRTTNNPTIQQLLTSTIEEKTTKSTKEVTSETVSLPNYETTESQTTTTEQQQTTKPRQTRMTTGISSATQKIKTTNAETTLEFLSTIVSKKQSTPISYGTTKFEFGTTILPTQSITSAGKTTPEIEKLSSTSKYIETTKIRPTEQEISSSAGPKTTQIENTPTNEVTPTRELVSTGKPTLQASTIKPTSLTQTSNTIILETSTPKSTKITPEAFTSIISSSTNEQNIPTKISSAPTTNVYKTTTYKIETTRIPISTTVGYETSVTYGHGQTSAKTTGQQSEMPTTEYTTTREIPISVTTGKIPTSQPPGSTISSESPTNEATLGSTTKEASSQTLIHTAPSVPETSSVSSVYETTLIAVTNRKSTESTQSSSISQSSKQTPAQPSLETQKSTKYTTKETPISVTTGEIPTSQRPKSTISNVSPTNEVTLKPTTKEASSQTLAHTTLSVPETSSVSIVYETTLIAVTNGKSTESIQSSSMSQSSKQTPTQPSPKTQKPTEYMTTREIPISVTTGEILTSQPPGSTISSESPTNEATLRSSTKESSSQTLAHTTSNVPVTSVYETTLTAATNEKTTESIRSSSTNQSSKQTSPQPSSETQKSIEYTTTREISISKTTGEIPTSQLPESTISNVSSTNEVTLKPTTKEASSQTLAHTTLSVQETSSVSSIYETTLTVVTNGQTTESILQSSSISQVSKQTTAHPSTETQKPTEYMTTREISSSVPTEISPSSAINTQRTTSGPSKSLPPTSNLPPQTYSTGVPISTVLETQSTTSEIKAFTNTNLLETTAIYEAISSKHPISTTNIGTTEFSTKLESTSYSHTREVPTTVYTECIPYTQDFFLTFFFDDTNIGFNLVRSYEQIVSSTVALPRYPDSERILNIYATSAPEFYGNVTNFNDTQGIQQLFTDVENSYRETNHSSTYNLTNSLLNYLETIDSVSYRTGAPAIVIFNSAQVDDIDAAMDVVRELHRHDPKVYILLIAFDQAQLANLSRLADFSLYFQSGVADAANWTLNTLCPYNQQPRIPKTTPEPTVFVTTTIEPTTELPTTRTYTTVVEQTSTTEVPTTIPTVISTTGSETTTTVAPTTTELTTTTEELSTIPYVPCIPYSQDFFLTFFFDDTRFGFNNLDSYEKIVTSTVGLPASTYTQRLLNIYSTSEPEFYGNVTYFNDTVEINRMFQDVLNSYQQTHNLPTYNLTNALLQYRDTVDTVDYRTGAPAIVILNSAQVDDVNSSLNIVNELRRHQPKIFILLIAFDQAQIAKLRPLVDFSMYFQSDVTAAANWTLNTLCRYNQPYNPPSTPEPTVFVPTTTEITTEVPTTAIPATIWTTIGPTTEAPSTEQPTTTAIETTTTEAPTTELTTTTEEPSTTPYVQCIPYNEDFFLTFFFDDTRIGSNNMQTYQQIVMSTVSLPTSPYTERLLNIYATSEPEFYGNVTYFNDTAAINQTFADVWDSFSHTLKLATYNLTNSLQEYLDTIDTISYKSGAPAIVILNSAQVDDVNSSLNIVHELRRHHPKIFILLIAFDQAQIEKLKPLVDFSMYFQSDVTAAANWTLNTLCRYNQQLHYPPTTEITEIVTTSTLAPTTTIISTTISSTPIETHSTIIVTTETTVETTQTTTPEYTTPEPTTTEKPTTTFPPNATCIPYTQNFFITFFIDDSIFGFQQIDTYKQIVNATIAQPTSNYTQRLLNIYSTSVPEFYGNVTSFNNSAAIQQMFNAVDTSYGNSTQSATYNLTDSLLQYFHTIDSITYTAKAPAIVIFNNAYVEDVDEALAVVENLHRHRPKVYLLLIAFDSTQLANLSPLVDFSMYFQNDYNAAAHWIINSLCRVNILDQHPIGNGRLYS